MPNFRVIRKRGFLIFLNALFQFVLIDVFGRDYKFVIILLGLFVTILILSAKEK